MSDISTLTRLQQLLPELFTPSNLPGESYLSYQLTPSQSALFALGQVQESLVLGSEEITPLPNMPPAVVGLMKSRQNVLLVVDLAQVLGLSTEPMVTRKYNLIVIRTDKDDITLGLVVQKIEGLVRVLQEEITEKLETVPQHLWGVVSGIVKQQTQSFWVLEGGAIPQLVTGERLK